MHHYRLVMKCWVLIVFCGLFWIADSGCSHREPIRIGFVASLSGRESDIACDCRDGAVLAVEQRNLLGGINGREVEMLVKDDGSNPHSAVEADRQLVKEGCKVIIGHVTSSMCELAIPYMNTTDSVMISPTSTSEEFAGKVDNFFRLYPSSGKLAAAQARYLFRECHLKRMVVVYDLNNRAHAQVWSHIVSDEFQRLGGQVLDQISFNSNTRPSFRLIATRVATLRPDCVVILGNVLDNAMICQHLRAQKCDALFAGSEWSATREMFNLGGKAIDGFVIAGFNDYTSKEGKYLDFIKAFNARYGRTPSILALHAYDAAKVALSALEDARNQGKTVKEILQKRRIYEGTQREIRLNASGDVENRARMSVVHDGEYRTVYEE